MEKVKVVPESLAPKFRSKKDLYAIMKYQLNIVKYYLTTIRKCPVSYLKQILSCEKKVYTESEINRIRVPSFNEFSVSKLWPKIKDNEYIKIYIPDYSDTEMPERDFLLNIVNTVYYGAIGALLKKALMNRAPKDQKDNDDLIEIDKHIHDVLKASIVYKTTPRRALSMLKISSKNRRSTPGLKLFDFDASVFRNPPTHPRVRRLLPSLGLGDNNRNRRHDAIMEEEKEDNEDER